MRRAAGVGVYCGTVLRVSGRHALVPFLFLMCAQPANRTTLQARMLSPPCLVSHAQFWKSVLRENISRSSPTPCSEYSIRKQIELFKSRKTSRPQFRHLVSGSLVILLWECVGAATSARTGCQGAEKGLGLGGKARASFHYC
jgi:hypothetical protein